MHNAAYSIDRYDDEYQLSHQTEGNEFPNTLVCPHDYSGFLSFFSYAIPPCFIRYKYCLLSITKLNKFNPLLILISSYSSTIVDLFILLRSHDPLPYDPNKIIVDTYPVVQIRS
jgi:hypothetical protein